MNESSREIPLSLPGFDEFEEIGRGGFGIVYRARQPALDRAVAIKVLVGAAVDTNAQTRFERERKTMGALSSHPAIVTIFDSGLTANGVPYLVMELMDGGSLGDRLLREGPVPWSEALTIGARVADALETAHRSGVVHRDVKPDNILLSSYGEAKLTDFGIASLLDATGTRSGGITASIAHAAPEVLEGRRATPRSDVYSLASTIYALIAGRPAFTRDTDEGMTPVIARILTEDPPDLRGFVPGPVVAVLERGLAKDPEARFATAADMAAALRGAANTPGVAVDPSAVTGYIGAAVAGAGLTGDIARSGEVPPPADVEGTRVVTGPVAAPAHRSRRGLILAAAAAVVAVAVLVGVAVAGGGGDDADGEVAAGGTSTTAADTTTRRSVADVTTTSAATTTTAASSTTTPLTGSASPTGGTANPIVAAATTTAAPAPTPEPPAPTPPRPSPSPSPSPTPSPTPTPPAPTPSPTPPPPAPAPTPTPPPPPALPTVPNVVGLDLTTASNQLKAAGFNNIPWETGCYGGLTNGVVFSQSPSGVAADPSTPIILKLEGDDCEFVPDVIGLDLASARAQLDPSGFHYTWLYNCYNSPNIGAVVSQNPAGGTDASTNQVTVNIFLMANNC